MGRPGEWTTYGDVSVAVTGHRKAARGVGRAAAKLAEFPNPHRILMQGRLINADWRTEDGLGPDECRRRLEEEGVTFGDKGTADAARRVPWDELMQRDALAAVV